MDAREVLSPPGVFTVPMVACPSCGHGIDPHGVDPGGPCGVGYSLEEGVRGIRTCQCLWSPNDIAWTLLRQQLETRSPVITIKTTTEQNNLLHMARNTAIEEIATELEERNLTDAAVVVRGFKVAR